MQRGIESPLLKNIDKEAFNQKYDLYLCQHGESHFINSIEAALMECVGVKLKPYYSSEGWAWSRAEARAELHAIAKQIKMDLGFTNVNETNEILMRTFSKR